MGKGWRLAGVVLSLLPLAATAEDRLTPLLQYAPADAVAGGPDAALMFFDFAAEREVLSALLAGDGGGEDAAERAEEFTGSRVGHLRAGFVDYLRYVVPYAPEYFGFDWRDVTVVATFGPPTDQPIVIAGGPAVGDAERVGAHLTTREFEPYQAAERDGRTVWWRFDDFSINAQLSDPADLFWGYLGGGARITTFEGALVGARTWAGLDRVLAVAAGDAASLAGSADFIALAHALDQPVEADGLLLQAMLVDGPIGDAASGRREDGVASVRWGTPAYEAVAVADRQEGRSAIAMIALAYTTRAEAETAAATVTTALAEGQGADGVPFAEALPYRVVSDVIEGPDGRRFIVRVALIEPLEAAPQSFSDAAEIPFRSLARMVTLGTIAGLLATGE